MKRIFRPSLAALLLVSAAACHDGPTAARIDRPVQPQVARLTCSVDAPSRTFSCGDAAVAGGAHADVLTMGGQNRYVRLASSGVAYDGGTDVLSANVTVQNLVQQALGTTDGVNGDSAGVRVFFSAGPTTTGGSGTVTLQNATGTATFTAPGQAYYQYGGTAGGELGPDGMLSTGETSSAKPWQFKMNGATSFTFTVYVQTAVASSSAAFLRFMQMAAGAGHDCGLTAAGQAWCWGLNNSGELGDASGSPQLLPVSVHQPAGVTFASITAGQHFTCGLTAAGQAYCWGYNFYGEVGDSTRTNRNVPTPVVQRNGLAFTALAAGYDHVCGLTSAGQAWCWGKNDTGQLGDSTTTQRLVPTAVHQPAETAFVAITASYRHTCALTAGGRAYCWGAGASGQIGDGQFSQQTKPSPVTQTGGASAFAYVAAGHDHTCAVSSSGEAYCWGDNFFGQAGTGTDGNSYGTPAAVTMPGGVSFGAITAGGGHTCALTTGGAAYCWGSGSLGQLGNGGIATPVDAPTPVSGGLAFAQILAMDNHSCGATAFSGAYCWGDNGSGQTGDGTSDQHNSPAAVAGTH